MDVITWSFETPEKSFLVITSRLFVFRLHAFLYLSPSTHSTTPVFVKVTRARARSSMSIKDFLKSEILHVGSYMIEVGGR